MSVVYSMPHNCRAFFTKTNFSAPPVVPVGGVALVFDFSSATQGQTVIKLQPGSRYFISNLSISGTIDELSFCNSLNPAPPILTLKYGVSGEPLLPQPIPVVSYAKGLEIGKWVHSDKSGESIICDVANPIHMIADTVGLSGVTLQVSFVVLVSDEQSFDTAMRQPEFSRILQV